MKLKNIFEDLKAAKKLAYEKKRNSKKGGVHVTPEYQNPSLDDADKDDQKNSLFSA